MRLIPVEETNGFTWCDDSEGCESQVIGLIANQRRGKTYIGSNPIPSARYTMVA